MTYVKVTRTPNQLKRHLASLTTELHGQMAVLVEDYLEATATAIRDAQADPDTKLDLEELIGGDMDALTDQLELLVLLLAPRITHVRTHVR